VLAAWMLHDDLVSDLGFAQTDFGSEIYTVSVRSHTQKRMEARQRFLASTARCSCRLFIRERPSIFSFLASL
jgi:hypothetical protein